ncbi:hypothetical protein Tco_1122281 [Tanacetum coccineum]|uniref:Uncharacterized protein n=1 Tax=Tanacetum coccineum TaxID=301880 RepID=A0ABQ5J0L3_9ASTR
MDDEFTATAYPKVQENLKLPTEGEVRLEEPASSAGTLSSMKNLDKDLSFTDQFLVERKTKPFRISMHILRGSKLCTMAIMEIPKTDPEEEEGEEPSGDDTDDEDEDEDEDEEEKEEHPASADFILPIYRMTARISIRDEPSMTDKPEITLPPRKRFGINLGPRYEIRESSTAAATRPIGGRRADYGFVGYGIRDVWVDPREAVEEVAPMTLEGVNARVTELTAVQEQDT